MKHIMTKCNCLILSSLMCISGCSINKLFSRDNKIEAEELTSYVDKRETLTATGYAVIGVQPHKNAAQQRLLAIRASKLDAYRTLTEQVYGLRLDANTTVASMIVNNDSLRIKVEGLIYGAKLVSIAPAGDDTYETTLTLDKDIVRELRTVFLNQLAEANAQ